MKSAIDIQPRRAPGFLIRADALPQPGDGD